MYSSIILSFSSFIFFIAFSCCFILLIVLLLLFVFFFFSCFFLSMQPDFIKEVLLLLYYTTLFPACQWVDKNFFQEFIGSFWAIDFLFFKYQKKILTKTKYCDIIIRQFVMRLWHKHMLSWRNMLANACASALRTALEARLTIRSLCESKPWDT